MYGLSAVFLKGVRGLPEDACGCACPGALCLPWEELGLYLGALLGGGRGGMSIMIHTDPARNAGNIYTTMRKKKQDMLCLPPSQRPDGQNRGGVGGTEKRDKIIFFSNPSA